MSELKKYVRVIENFPKDGISFKDIMGILANASMTHRLIDALKKTLEGVQADLIVAPEARGFLIGMPLAYALSMGFVPARRPGKLPPPVRAFTYSLEYGVGILEIARDAIAPGAKIIVVDDLLATGGTTQAVCDIVERLGGEVVACRYAIELLGLKGREALSKYDVKSVITYENA